jgi:hypothetical protein
VDEEPFELMSPGHQWTAIRLYRKIDLQEQKEMGRAGIKPATLGLRVDACGFAGSRMSSGTGLVEQNRLG